MKQITMADWKVTRKQKKLINRVLKSGRLTYGEMTKKLEEKFAAIHCRKHALFTSSGTAALQVAIHALKEERGWKNGDEVLMPAVTFVATMNVILMNNLKPKLVDVGGDVNIDPTLIEKEITKKTRAIVVVHLLGQPADMKAIMKIAKKHNLAVIEDSCETMFVSRDGCVVGSMGDVACFSTYIAHLMVTGVGGFITTNDTKLATIMRSMMFHGRDEAYLNIDDNAKENIYLKRFNFPRQGYSHRATELEAALGLGDLDSWNSMIKKRQDNAIYLMDRLKEAFMWVFFPVSNPYEHAFMFFPMFAYERDGLMEYLENHGIQTREMMPLLKQPVVKNSLKIKKRYPMADNCERWGLLIGCHQYMDIDDLDYIADTIIEYYRDVCPQM